MTAPPETYYEMLEERLPGLVKNPAPTLPEPHASWVDPLEKAWAQRYGA